MSLQHVRTKFPCITYPDAYTCFPSDWQVPNPAGCCGAGYAYNKFLIVCPRHYCESIDQVSHFFYDPGSDLLRLYLWFKTVAWPGAAVRRYDFNADTGDFEGAYTASIYLSWTGAATMGSYSKIYAPANVNTTINEVDPGTLWAVAGGWTVNPMTWTPPAVYFHAMVNRQDQVLAGVSSWTLDSWRNINTTPEMYGRLQLPAPPTYACYESRNNCWLITADGVICKADYLVPRWEMISGVQDPTADAKGYKITFDSKRKRVIVFRWREDAADGACQSQLEWYYPLVDATKLTAPVPVSSLRTGNRIELVAHLCGQAGEGATPFVATGEMVAPVEGLLKTPFASTEANGRVTFQYQAPGAACEETLELTVETSDG